jgi:NTE family protein
MAAANGPGLALSGGGYRASAFHLGTLNKLYAMGVLEKIDVMSTISGGSITGAAWCLSKDDYPAFHAKMMEQLRTKSVVKYILTSWRFFIALLFLVVFIGAAIWLSFTYYSWLVFPVLIIFFWLLLRYQFRIFPVSKIIEQAYDKFFYHKQQLQDLKHRPILAIGSSNLHTGRPFTFSWKKMGDSAYASEFTPPVTFEHEGFPVARAVMASSCVPFAFTPVPIAKEFYTAGTDFNRVKPMLIDGGVYDNQGIQKLTQPKSSYECNTIIVSDAGGNFLAEKKYPNAIALLIRTVDLFMYRIKAVQMVQNIYRNVEGAAKPIAYFSLGWKIEGSIPGFVENMCRGQIIKEVIDAQGFKDAWKTNPKTYREEIAAHLEERTGYASILKRNLSAAEWEKARAVGTNLTKLSKETIDLLIRHAENLTELQVKLYCPTL